MRRLRRIKGLPQRHLRMAVVRSLITAVSFGASSENFSAVTQGTTREVINTVLGTRNTRVSEEAFAALLCPGFHVLPSWHIPFSLLSAWIRIANSEHHPLAAGAWYQSSSDLLSSPHSWIASIARALSIMGWSWTSPFVWTTPQGSETFLQFVETPNGLLSTLAFNPELTTSEFREAFRMRSQLYRTSAGHILHLLREDWRKAHIATLARRRPREFEGFVDVNWACLLYTSDAADE